MNQSRLVIAGTIASGKSTLSNLLREKGYKVIDSDEVNRELLKTGGENFQAIKRSSAFDEAFEEDFLDKKKLAKIIYGNKEKRKLLNKLTHKNIIKKIEEEINSANKDLVFIEIPLYFSMEEKFPNDGVWLVEADREVQIKRLMERDGINRAYAEKKLESGDQRKIMEDESLFIFDNSGSLKDLEDQLNLALEELKNESN